MRFTSCAVLAATLAASAVAARGDTFTVHVYNFGFSTIPGSNPQVEPIINLGDTVRWTWDSGFHSVTSVAGILEVFNSGDHGAPFTFDHTFTNLGDWQYFCDIHGFDAGGGNAGGMSGVVHVVPAPSVGAMISGGVLLLLRRRR